MSRYEQRKKTGIETRLSAMGIKDRPKDNAVVFLQNTGNKADLIRQEAIYYRQGFDKVGGDESGIVMEIPKDENAKNMARYQEESRRVLEIDETTNITASEDDARPLRGTAGRAKPVKPEVFLDTDE